MTQEIIICPFKESDLPFIQELQKTNNLQRSKQSLSRDIQENKAKILILKKNEQALAYIYFKVIDIESEIYQLAVKETYRRQGFGQKLIEEIQKLYPQIQKIHLEVSHQNIVAIRFYTKNDFKKVGRRKSYYQNGDDALLMTRHITRSSQV